MKHIYGLFIGNRCFYVGSTLNPRARMSAHRSSGKAKMVPAAVMRIFRTCDPSSSERIERQVIVAFKKKGQAQMNEVLSINENLRPNRGQEGFESASLRFYAAPELLRRFKALSAKARGDICTLGLAAMENP